MRDWRQFIGKHVLTTKEPIDVQTRHPDIMRRLATGQKIYLAERRFNVYYYTTASVPPVEQDDVNWFTLFDADIARCKVEI